MDEEKYPQRPEALDPLELLLGSSEPNIDAENWVHIFCKSNKHS